MSRNCFSFTIGMRRKSWRDWRGHYLVCDGYQATTGSVGGPQDAPHTYAGSSWMLSRRRTGKWFPEHPVSREGSSAIPCLCGNGNMQASPPDQKKLKRLEHEKPVLEAFWAWLDKQNPESGSRLDKAVTYARNQRAFMENYLLDGRIEISNQISENSVRPFAVGRRNWLFSDSTNGAVASTAVYSLIETAK